MTAVSLDGRLRRRLSGDCDDRPIVIGLVNNMADAALGGTERQFRRLLSAASSSDSVRLRLFSLPELPRSEAARTHIQHYYEDIGELWATEVDGLIVTGVEPREDSLTDEPYWRTLTKLVDWSEDHTVSAIWSCLAAHAAVLHTDGIVRRALCEKLVGVFECVKAADHAIVLGVPPRWRVPHSRHNEIPEDSLVAKGYRILSRSADAGVDMFVSQRKSLSLFLQGHPEYDAGALLREYRRDIRRFLAGESASYPKTPCNYFDPEMTAAVAAFQREAEALGDRGIELSSGFPAVDDEKLANDWYGVAATIYKNWLSYLVARRFRTDSAETQMLLFEGETSAIRP